MIYDAIVIGGGAAGLSAALNLARARRTVMLIDSNRPRNAATLVSHGFVTRDGISPLELRRLGREEVDAYPEGTVRMGCVRSLRKVGATFRLVWDDLETCCENTDEARSVVIATGVSEQFPNIADIRAYYGTSLHSCVECDAYEKGEGSIVLIGETDDLAERAVFLSQWNSDVTVFTNSVGVVTSEEERFLGEHGIRVDRRKVRAVHGDRGVMTGLLMDDGPVVPGHGGFVRPVWERAINFVRDMDVTTTVDGAIVVDGSGRTNINGLYAAGDSTSLVPSQLIVAAGTGAVVASSIARDLALNALAK